MTTAFKFRIRTVAAAVLLPGVLLAVPAPAQTPPTAVLTDIRGVAFADRIEYTIFITGIFRYVQSESGRPRRLALDLEPVDNRWAPVELAGQAFGVQAVRVTETGPRKVRVEFVLGAEGPATSVRMTGDGLRVVFRKGETTEQVKAPPGHPEVERPPARATVAETPAAQVPPVKPAASAASRPAGLPSILIGGSLAFQILSDPRFTEVFGDGNGRSLGLDLAMVLMPASRVRPAIGLDYHRLSKSGESTITGTPTELTLEPVTVSGMLLFEMRPVTPYIGVGACFTRYRELSDLRDTDGSAAGVSVQAGVLVRFGRQNVFLMKLFGRWASVTAEENGLELELGGTAIGLSALFGFL